MAAPDAPVLKQPEHRVRVDSGKYTFVIPSGGLRVEILRHGEPWHDQEQAFNALHSIMCELDAARVVIAAAREFPGDGATILRALRQHDALVSDREPPGAWTEAVLIEPVVAPWYPPPLSFSVAQVVAPGYEHTIVDQTPCSNCGHWKGDHHPACMVTGKHPYTHSQAHCTCDAFTASVPPEPTYPCTSCGKLRTKAEGGTTFTVCETCWDKSSPAAPAAPLTAEAKLAALTYARTVLDHHLARVLDGGLAHETTMSVLDDIIGVARKHGVHSPG